MTDTQPNGWTVALACIEAMVGLMQHHGFDEPKMDHFAAIAIAAMNAQIGKPAMAPDKPAARAPLPEVIPLPGGMP